MPWGSTHAARADVAADCALVTRQEAGSIAGVGVTDADENAMRNGTCLFGSRSATEDGLARYSVVRPERLAALRAFFTVARVSCGNVAPGTIHYAACQTYGRLAIVSSVADYCAIRSDIPARTPIGGLGSSAFVTTEGAFVLHGTACVEAFVDRDAQYDPKRTESLARLVVSRLK